MPVKIMITYTEFFLRNVNVGRVHLQSGLECCLLKMDQCFLLLPPDQFKLENIVFGAWLGRS